MFLTPDGHLPIFAGTYFPKSANYGMPSFRDVLERVESYFRQNRDDVHDAGRRIVTALDNMTAVEGDQAAAQLSARPVAAARRQFGDTFDNEYGGFGGAPKFPHATNIDFLLESWHRSLGRDAVDEGAKRMCMQTLERMALGGLYDHLGGGFFRYSVDQRWAIPHFEKMLYDNAALLATYADAHAATGDPLHERIAAETADWIMRDMQGNEGEYFATLDADSEGHEGQVLRLDSGRVRRAARAGGSGCREACLRSRGGPRISRAVPGTCRSPRAMPVARRSAIPAMRRRSCSGARPGEAAGRPQRARLARSRREGDRGPGTGLRSARWRGLQGSSTGRSSRRPPHRAADFVRERLWIDGRLKSVYKDGRARFAGYLDDYAFLAAGLLELLQCRWRTSDLEFAVDLIEVVPWTASAIPAAGSSSSRTITNS